MAKNSKSKASGRNKYLSDVAALTGFSYGYVRQVAIGHRSNMLIERAIVAFEEHDFITLQEIKLEIESSKQVQ